MGVSTDAILAFGVSLDEFSECEYKDFPWATDEDEDLEDTLARLAGAPQYPDEGWLEAKRAAVDACPLEMVMHCSYSCTDWILAVKGTVTTASRGYPEEITSLDEGDHLDTQYLLDFLSKYGIEGEPKWYLCSMWG